MNAKTGSVWARRKARRALVQAIYQWQMSGGSNTGIAAEFADGEALKKADEDFFKALLKIVLQEADDLDAAYVSLLDRSVDQLDHVERAVLRLAVAEFIHRIDVPYRVVIDEYVELAKTFGAQDSYKYINGVLDALAGQLRSVEVGSGG